MGDDSNDICHVGTRGTYVPYTSPAPVHGSHQHYPTLGGGGGGCNPKKPKKIEKKPVPNLKFVVAFGFFGFFRYFLVFFRFFSVFFGFLWYFFGFFGLNFDKKFQPIKNHVKNEV